MSENARGWKRVRTFLVKHLVTLILYILTSFAVAQLADALEEPIGSFEQFEVVFFYSFEVAETACPQAYTEEALCYVHGYDDFFSFKALFTERFLEFEALQRWRLTEVELEGERAQAFEATYRLADADTFTITYLQENFLFLER